MRQLFVDSIRSKLSLPISGQFHVRHINMPLGVGREDLLHCAAAFLGSEGSLRVVSSLPPPGVPHISPDARASSNADDLHFCVSLSSPGPPFIEKVALEARPVVPKKKKKLVRRISHLSCPSLSSSVAADDSVCVPSTEPTALRV